MVATQKTSVVVSQGELDRPAGVAHFLAPVVNDLVALAVNGKQAHWHVRGANFIGVHEYLDTIVEHAQDASDEVAERIVALGLPLDARIGSVAAKNSLPEISAGFQNSETTITEIIASLDAVLATIYAAIDGLAEIDAPSQDIVIALAQTFDKDRWFMNSHIAN